MPRYLFNGICFHFRLTGIPHCTANSSSEKHATDRRQTPRHFIMSLLGGRIIIINSLQTGKGMVPLIRLHNFRFLILLESANCLTAEQKMSVVSPLVLVILGSFIHCACAIKCYECVSYHGQWCDDPLLPIDSQNKKIYVREKTCLPIYDACLKGEGSDGKNSETVFLARLT